MRLNKRRLQAITLMSLFAMAPTSFAQINLDQRIQQKTQERGVQIVDITGVDKTYPSRAKPDVLYQQEDLSYRVQDVLPFTQDKNNNAYIVYPKYGIIVPVRELSSSDQQVISQGQQFDHYKYLQQGSLHYVGSRPSEGMGNMVIAGHSAFNTDDAGRYKTAFQSVVYSQVGDKIRYFEKTNDGSYTRYTYQIGISQEVATDDTSILYHTEPVSQLTTYTCYPIGSTDSRWYNKANLIETKEGFNINKPIVEQVITQEQSPELPDEQLQVNEATTSIPEPTTEITPITVSTQSVPQIQSTVDINANTAVQVVTQVVESIQISTPVSPSEQTTLNTPVTSEPTNGTGNSGEVYHYAAQSYDPAMDPLREATKVASAAAQEIIAYEENQTTNTFDRTAQLAGLHTFNKKIL